MDGKWIRLEEQNHDFALDKNLPVKGRLQLGYGKVLFRGGNLKSSGNVYKLFFIGRKNGSSVYKIMGDILPDQQGNVEFRTRIDPSDIDGEGTALSCFYIFMVAAMGKPIRPVLKGDLIKLQGIGETDGNKTARQNGYRQPDLNIKIYNNYYSQYILEKVAVLETSAVEFAPTAPFDDAWLVDSWRRVADTALIPIASTGAERQIRKYGHFIFGLTEKHFYLAVPGKHIEEEWPDRGKSGFMMWQPIRNTEEYGYWCMVIDRKTGIITEIS